MARHSSCNHKSLALLMFMVLGLASLLTLVFGPATVFAEAAKPISGNYTASYAMQKAMAVPDAKGHVLRLVETHATNKNTGPTDFLEDAKVVNREIRDLVQGNGTHNATSRSLIMMGRSPRNGMGT